MVNDCKGMVGDRQNGTPGSQWSFGWHRLGKNDDEVTTAATLAARYLRATAASAKQRLLRETKEGTRSAMAHGTPWLDQGGQRTMEVAARQR